VVHLNPICIL
jgi:hypothetical protein